MRWLCLLNIFFINVLASCFLFFFFPQKRRSNRQVKRKKYAEELEARLSDDEVKVIVKTKKTNTAASKQPALQLFVVSSSANSSVVAQKASLHIFLFFCWENQRAKRLKPNRVHYITFKLQFYKVFGSSWTTDCAKDCVLFFFVFFSGHHAHKLSSRAHLCTGKNKKHILERNNSTTCEVKNSTACSVHHRAVTCKPGPLQYACT